MDRGPRPVELDPGRPRRARELDDGAISTVDAGRLLELRLTRAGFEATLDDYPGGHTVSNKIPELVDYLKRAAAL